MSQKRHREGPHDDGWDHDDRQLPPSLGIWPLGRTYVHSSDGALSTGPARVGGPAGPPALSPVEGPYRRDPVAGQHPQVGWPGRQGLGGGQLAAPPFTGSAGDGSTPVYERLALYERLSPPPPADPGPSRRGRPPLYQVGGRYRGDDWPTDPGFRRGDLGPEDLPTGPAPDRRRPGPGYDPGLGGSHPKGVTALAGPSSYGAPGHGAAPGHGGARYGAAAGPGGEVLARHEPSPAPPPRGAHAAGADMTARRPQQGERRDRDPRSVTPIRPDAPAGQAPGRQGGETWEGNLTPAARVAAVEDARLLAFLDDLTRRLKAVPSLYPRLVFLVVGYAAITSLAAAYAAAIPLPIAAGLVVVPAAGVIFNLSMRHPDWGRRALVGWLAGIAATIICDCLRLSLVKVGVWGDQVPGIGRLVFADPHANFAWGYLWGFAANGGGMGIAYTMLPWRGVRSGIAYGTLICTGLVALLFFLPVTQVHFFPLTPVTAVGAYAGHWVYGAVLGKITSWWLPPVELGRIHGRLTARLIHPGHRPRPAHARRAGADRRRAAARRSA